MALTRRQKRREEVAKLCDWIADGKSQTGKEIRAGIRRTEKRKREQARRPK